MVMTLRLPCLENAPSSEAKRQIPGLSSPMTRHPSSVHLQPRKRHESKNQISYTPILPQTSQPSKRAMPDQT